MRNDSNFTTVPDLDTLAKNYIATKAMVGKKAYELPQADWPKEKWAEWNKTIGVPEKSDNYSKVDSAALEKAGLPPEVISTATQKFHEMGLTDRQAKGLLDWYVGDAAKGSEIQQQAVAASKIQGEQTLKREFGDKFDAKMALVPVWLKQNADPAFLEAIEKAGLGSDPNFVKAIIKSAEATLEDTSRSGNTGAPGGGEGASALQEIEQMKIRRLSEPTYAAKFEDPRTPERQRWEQLHQIAYSSKK